MRKMLLLVIALLVPVLGACSAPAEESPCIIEPSALISREEAESIMGTTLDTVRDVEEPRVGLKQRLYESQEHLFQIGLTQQAMMPAGQPQTPESIYRAIVDNFDDAVSVPGIGDEAYFATPGLHILQDGYYILVAVGNLSDETNQEKLKTAGKLAVTNLKAIAA